MWFHIHIGRVLWDSTLYPPHFSKICDGEIYLRNKVHRKTDSLFPGNNMTVAELEPLTIWSEGSSSNHYAALPPFFCGLHYSYMYKTYCMVNPNQHLSNHDSTHLSYYAEEVVHTSLDVISLCDLLVHWLHSWPKINIKYGVLLSREYTRWKTLQYSTYPY